MNKLKQLLLLLSFLLTGHLFAQQKIDVKAESTPIIKVIKDIKKRYKISFFYSNDLKELNKKITVDLKQVTVVYALGEILKGTNLAYKFVNDQVVIKKKTEIDLKDKDWIITENNSINTKEKKTISIGKKQSTQKDQIRLSGYIRDKQTGEEIIGATIVSLTDQTKTISNNYGYYSFSVSKGEQIVRFSCNGYQSDTLNLVVMNDSILNHHLDLPIILIAPIVISSSESSQLLSDLSSKKELNLSKNLAKGSISSDDIIDNVRMQSGVLSKSEGSTGYFVRGGNYDQNLILIDGAPIYNESHFLGLLSVFNSNSIKKATLYKSGLPAEYGSRLSSVLDIQTKEGNNEKMNYYGSLNPFFIDYSLEGPLKKEKSSFFISGRNSTLGLLFKPVMRNNLDVDVFRFYDFNAKVNYRINDKNRVFISSYFGRDVFHSNSSNFELNESWGNFTTSFKWNHLFNPKVFTNTQVIYSEYRYNNYENYDDVDYFMDSKIKALIFKQGITYYQSNTHKISFGLQSQIQYYEPGNTSTDGLPTNSDTTSVLKIKFNNTLESAIYAQDEVKINSKLNCSVGTRLSCFNHFGEGKNYIFGLNNSVDSIMKSGIYNFYYGIEPRIKLSYKITSTGLITLSYDRTYQYLTLASNSISRSPTDVWVPSSNNILPQNMNLFTAGINYAYDSTKYILNTSIYYKDLNNIVDFVDNAYLKLNQLIESQIKQGKGTSYGFELMLSKVKGDFTFTLNYHLGKATYTISGINEGKTYYAPYHKLHSGNLNLNYKLNSSFEIQTNCILSSGTRTTFPIATYTVQGNQFILYNERNADALPTYFRIDASLTYHGKQKKWGKDDIIFSVYNLTNRKNPYSITFEKNTTTAYYNYLLPIIPSLTYKVYFK